MAQRRNIRDRLKKSFGTEQELNESIAEGKTPEVTLSGGVYRVTPPTYTDTDNALFHFDVNGNLNTNSLLSNSGIGDGRKIIATTGTAETLAASTACKEVTITAETNNTNIVTIGGSTVVGALATRRGTPLEAGDSVTLKIDDLAKIYVDVITDGEGVTYSYLT